MTETRLMLRVFDCLYSAIMFIISLHLLMRRLDGETINLRSKKVGAPARDWRRPKPRGKAVSGRFGRESFLRGERKRGFVLRRTRSLVCAYR